MVQTIMWSEKLLPLSLILNVKFNRIKIVSKLTALRVHHAEKKRSAALVS